MNTEQKFAWFVLGYYVFMLLTSIANRFLFVPMFGNGDTTSRDDK